MMPPDLIVAWYLASAIVAAFIGVGVYEFSPSKVIVFGLFWPIFAVRGTIRAFIRIWKNKE